MSSARPPRRWGRSRLVAAAALAAVCPRALAFSQLPAGRFRLALSHPSPWMGHGSATATPRRFLSSPGSAEDDEFGGRTTFEDAGATLLEQLDQAKTKGMEDFDLVPESGGDATADIRAEIRARAATLGIEKSLATEQYVAKRQAEALERGPGGGTAGSDDIFGGLDLSKISPRDSADGDGKAGWDERLPSFLYDASEYLEKDEQEVVDPIITKNKIEQFQYELSLADRPMFLGLTVKTFVTIVVTLACAYLLLKLDTFLLGSYTSIGIVSSDEKLQEYIRGLQDLDLPKGWLDGMSEDDVTSFTQSAATGLPDL